MQKYLNDESVLQAICCRAAIATSKSGILRKMTLKLKTQVTTLCLITSQYLSGTYIIYPSACFIVFFVFPAAFLAVENRRFFHFPLPLNHRYLLPKSSVIQYESRDSVNF